MSANVIQLKPAPIDTTKRERDARARKRQDAAKAAGTKSGQPRRH